MALQIGEFSWAEQFSPYKNLMQSMVVTVKEKPITSLPSIVASVSEHPRRVVVEGDFVVPSAKGVPLQPVNDQKLTEINQNSAGTKSLVFQHFSEYWPAYVIGGIVVTAWLIHRYQKKKSEYIYGNL